MFTKKSFKELREKFGGLLVHNLHLRGLSATIYCFGLSASRYIEYASALAFLSSDLHSDDVILEIGCGHSILPTLWKRLNFQVIVVDVSQNALKWQANKSKEDTNKSLHAVLADGKNLPFRDDVVSAISCISTIEHFPNDADIQAAYEIGRVLKPNGSCVISFSLSPYTKSYSKKDWVAEIPPLIKRFLKLFLPSLFERLSVDRTSSYFERFYNLEDVRKRITKPSRCSVENHFTLRSGRVNKFIYEKIIPTGVLTPLEYLMARFLTVSKHVKDAGAIVLKLRKPFYEKDV